MRSGNRIVSFGFGPLHYKSGIKRLAQSLTEVEWSGESNISWKNEYPDHIITPYCFKPRIMERMKNTTDTRDLLWVDSSMYFVKNPEPIFSKIEEKGYYFVDNGYNCAQTCNDRCLEIFEITRDEAEKIPELASGVVGLDLESPLGLRILELWNHYTNEGASRGSRTHNPRESSDPRFLFHRQDQSVLSLIANKLSLSLYPMGELWDFYTDKHIAGEKKINDSVVLLCRGM